MQSAFPLVVLTPKSLLRHPRNSSHLADFVSGEFHLVLDDTAIQDRDAVKRVLLCTGKVYYDLARRTRETKWRGRRPREAGAALSLPGMESRPGVRLLPACPGGLLGAGRTPEHGSLELRAQPVGPDPPVRPFRALRGAPGKRQSGHGLAARAPEAAGGPHRHGFRLPDMRRTPQATAAGLPVATEYPAPLRILSPEDA